MLVTVIYRTKKHVMLQNYNKNICKNSLDHVTSNFWCFAWNGGVGYVCMGEYFHKNPKFLQTSILAWPKGAKATDKRNHSVKTAPM